jgi:phosphatidate cytidylyltransferase
MKNNFLKRLLSSILLLSIFYFILIIENYLFLIFLIFLFLVSIYEWNNLVKNKSLKLFGFIFLSLSYFTVHEIKNIDTNSSFFVFVISVCVGSDFGGYVFGKLLGGPKLTTISPKKTYSGFFGGILCAILFGFSCKFLFNLTLPNYTFHNFNFLLTIILLSVTSQFGDLVISFFKRKANLDDTGKIIPGHGGLLDRIDGMIFAFPLFYLFAINNFN